MNTEIKHITQLTQSDLREIAAATCPTPGFGIIIERTQGQLKIGIDENALKVAIAAFVLNGGTSATSISDICAVPLELPS